MSFKYAVALTGGISTGKSSATVLLSLYGFKFIDLDKISHKILDENREKIFLMFGKKYQNSDFSINRKKLGQLIFSNKQEKNRLENFLHPLIYDEAERQSIIEDKFKIIYIIDIPLFFEKNRYPIEKSIVVYCSFENQLKRLMKRDNINKENALLMINNQMDTSLKKDKATYVINNDKDLKNLQSECEILKINLLNI